MTEREALQIALQALKTIDEAMPFPVAKLAQSAIKEALAQPEQEPVAFASHGVVNWIADKQFQHEALLYSAPQRTWVGLTKNEVETLSYIAEGNTWKAVELAEAKLKSKNNADH